ncbi:MAG: DUF4838 domain-containing protein [Planctomycetaceae bacterium]
MLTRDGKSSYVIYHEAEAAESVRFAARELQRVIQIASGVTLPIQHEPAEGMISLGDHPAARNAGFSAEKFPDDGFVVTAKGKNIFILGKDSPDDKPQWLGWKSQGTLFGTFEFLETVVGVRWLMPGEWGEDIPDQPTLLISELSIEEAPDFSIRYLGDIQDRARGDDTNPQAVVLWLRHQKMPTTAEGQKLQHGHAWDEYIPVDLWKAHPEFLAADAEGKRRTFEKPAHVKYCLTNPDVVKHFAAGVIRWLDENPRQRSASISPSDGGDFCLCPDCKALLTKDPHGKDSWTDAMLAFNNQIARIVGEKHPDRILASYVYYNYMYPPQRPVKIEPNLWLVWAPLNYYGWGLQKPVYREEFPEVIEGWMALTKNFMYHNYSTWFRSFNGAILPPGFDILTLELPTLYKHGVHAVDMVGMGAWGYGAVSNYLLARQMWDAEIDVHEEYIAWLQRAYGPAWEEIEQIYQKVESRMKTWKEQETPAYRGHQYEINYELIDYVYRPIFSDIERHYLSAVSKVETDPQRKRLEMFGDNMIMLHYSLRKAEMIGEAEKSPLYRTDEQYAQFIKDTEFSLSLYRNHGKRFTGPIWKGSWQGD